MLQKIHDQAQSWIAWVIVGLLIVPFALWGVNSYFEGASSAVVAEVNGTEITMREYENSLQQQRQRMRAILGDNYSPQLLENPQMRRAVLDGMVENELLTQAIQEDGYRVGDAILFGQLQQIDAFQHDGAFSPAIYEQVLASQGMSKPFFENSMRIDIMQSQLRRAFLGSAYVTEDELREAARLQEQQRAVRTLTIPADRKRLASQKVSEDAINTHYEANGRVYEIPEQLTIEYVELSVAQLMDAVVVNDDEVRKLYEERKENLIADEERRASHILIELPEGATAQEQEKAEARLQEVQQKLAEGAAFQELARNHSDDFGSASEGGNLGFFGRGIMVSEFEEVAFSMETGSISEPVRTPFGYHLIRLDEIQTAQTRSYEEVYQELLGELKRRLAEEQYYELSETISNIAYEEPDSLHGVAETAGVTLKKSDWFGRNGGQKGITKKPTVVQAAFSDLVLNEGKNSDPVELADDHIVILRVDEYRAASRKPLESVRSEVVEGVLSERARTMAQEQGSGLLQGLQSGEQDSQKGATELGIDWGEQDMIKRTGTANMPREVVARAFQMKLPEREGSAAYGGVTAANGDYILVELSAVVDGELETLDPPQREALRRNLTEGNMESHYRSYLSGLRGEADVDIFEDQL